MAVTDFLITLSILLGIFIIIYTKVKNQELKDTIDELIEVLNPAQVEPGIMP